MRGLTSLSRRRFGQGLGASLALASVPHVGAAHDGSHVVTVRMSRFAFVPAKIELRPGDTVVWVNDDLVPHTATANDEHWDTGTVETDGSARITFATPGDFDYFCVFHPHMTGTISVRSDNGG